MAPELVFAIASLSRDTDVYAFAMVTLEVRLSFVALRQGLQGRPHLCADPCQDLALQYLAQDDPFKDPDRNAALLQCVRCASRRIVKHEPTTRASSIH